jgi:palmitoyltransferase ZDHHC4
MINDYTSISHPISFVVLGFLALWSYYKACKAKPGKITIESVDMLIEKYRPYYDGLIYKKNNKCKTCNFIKPARSKHCTVCNICV